MNSLKPKSHPSKLHLLLYLLVFALIGGSVLLLSHASPNPNLPGDLNNDNKVDGADLAFLASVWKTSNASADLNSDSTVNIADLSILLAHYGQSITAAKPSIPTGLTATPGDGQVSLRWNANPTGDNVDTYQVYVNGVSNKLDVSATSYTVTGLTNNTSYAFRVSAHNSAGYGDWTAAVNSTPSGSTGTLLKFGSFDGGNLSDFSDSTCHSGNVAVHVGGGPNNTNWARFSGTSATQCYGDTVNMRIHMLGFPGGSPNWFDLGGTTWGAISMRMPSGFTNGDNTNTSLYAGTEIHGDNGTGSAPLNLSMGGGYWTIIVRGSDNLTPNPPGGYPYAQYLFGPNPGAANLYEGKYYRRWQDWAGGNHPVTANEWVNFRLGFHFDTTDNNGVGNGWFEAWARWGNMTSWANIVPRVSGIPLGDPDIDGNGSALYPMLSLYRPVSGASGTYAIDYADGAWSDDFATLANWQNGRLGF